MERTSCDSSYHCRDGHPCQSCRSVLACPAPKMCHLSTEDQYVCEINQGGAEAVTCLLGGAQFPSCPFYHPRSSCCRFGHPRETSVSAGNFPDSNGISDYFKRRKRSHHTEPVPPSAFGSIFGNRTPAGIILDKGDGDAFRCLGSLPSLYIYTGQAIAGNLAMGHDVDHTAWRHVRHMDGSRR
jgi:hypothetical protein